MTNSAKFGAAMIIGTIGFASYLYIAFTTDTPDLPEGLGALFMILWADKAMDKYLDD